MKGRRLFGGLFGRAVKLPAAMCTTANAGKFFCNGDTVCESTGVVVTNWESVWHTDAFTYHSFFSTSNVQATL